MTAVTDDRDARRAFLDALREVEQARKAFEAEVRAGRNGAAAYLAWKRAVEPARKAAAVPAEQFEARYQARLSEFRWLSAEARRLDSLAPLAGKVTGRGSTTPETGYSAGRHEADCRAWLARASAYAGHEVTAVSADAIVIDPVPKAAERPPVPAVPGVPPYADAMLRAVSGD